MGVNLDQQRIKAKAFAVKDGVVYLFLEDDAFRRWWDQNPDWGQAGWLDSGAVMVRIVPSPDAGRGDGGGGER